MEKIKPDVRTDTRYQKIPDIRLNPSWKPYMLIVDLISLQLFRHFNGKTETKYPAGYQIQKILDNRLNPIGNPIC